MPAQPPWRLNPFTVHRRARIAPAPTGTTDPPAIPPAPGSPTNQAATQPKPAPAKLKPKPPSFLKIATYNMQDGRNSKLPTLLRNLQVQNIDLCIATETKFPPGPNGDPGIHTRHDLGYDVFCTYTTTPNQGGIALISRTGADNWHVESQLRHGPNVISCILVSGHKHTPVIGAYLAPSHLNDLPHLEAALARFKDSKAAPLVLGDLNVNLSDLSKPRTAQVSATIMAYGLEDMLLHFRQRHKLRHLKTWWQHRNGQTFRSRCDYILATDRRLFQSVTMKNPRHYSSDHFMLVGKYLAQPAKQHKGYLRGRKAFPIRSPPPGPDTPQTDQLFNVLKAQTVPPCWRDQSLVSRTAL